MVVDSSIKACPQYVLWQRPKLSVLNTMGIKGFNQAIAGEMGTSTTWDRSNRRQECNHLRSMMDWMPTVRAWRIIKIPARRSHSITSRTRKDTIIKTMWRAVLENRHSLQCRNTTRSLEMETIISKDRQSAFQINLLRLKVVVTALLSSWSEAHMTRPNIHSSPIEVVE